LGIGLSFKPKLRIYVSNVVFVRESQTRVQEGVLEKEVGNFTSPHSMITLKVEDYGRKQA
jgi:hypothetical protein